MNHRDAMISEVTITYDETPENPRATILQNLRDVGLVIKDSDPDDGCVEGVVPANKLPEVHAVPGVKYVRISMEYIADYPKGDPRDRDGD